jgi:NAD(P)-dependent dehydrogenase (short-subunit alcohol dehydrogenase family)
MAESKIDLSVSALFGVKGKTIVVTGGGRGIGRSIAEGYVRNGAKVFICSRVRAALIIFLCCICLMMRDRCDQ